MGCPKLLVGKAKCLCETWVKCWTHSSTLYSSQIILFRLLGKLLDPADIRVNLTISFRTIFFGLKLRRQFDWIPGRYYLWVYISASKLWIIAPCSWHLLHKYDWTIPINLPSFGENYQRWWVRDVHLSWRGKHSSLLEKSWFKYWNSADNV